jgi:hypothetical protein
MIDKPMVGNLLSPLTLDPKKVQCEMFPYTKETLPEVLSSGRKAQLQVLVHKPSVGKGEFILSFRFLSDAHLVWQICCFARDLICYSDIPSVEKRLDDISAANGLTSKERRMKRASYNAGTKMWDIAIPLSLHLYALDYLGVERLCDLDDFRPTTLTEQQLNALKLAEEKVRLFELNGFELDGISPVSGEILP